MPLPNTEPVPAYYYDSRVTRELGESNPELALLENLRSQLLFAEFNPQTTEALYGVARTLGDHELYGSDPTGETGKLLDASRYHAGPCEFAAGTVEHSIGFLHTEKGILGVGLDELDQVAKDLQRLTKESGEPLLKGSDGYLVAFLQTAGHETGHAVLNGIARSVEPQIKLPYNKLKASAMYLADHPEAGVTGNWEADVAIQEERFAEGYGNMVAKRALTTLGYDEADSKAIMSHLSLPEAVKSDPAGHHQLDWLEQVTDKVAAHHFVKTKKVLNKVDQKGGQTYDGALGYGLPLSKEAMVAQLRASSFKIKSIAVDKTVQPEIPESWAQSVKANQDPQIKTYLGELKQTREQFLTEVAKDAAKQERRQARKDRRAHFIGRVSFVKTKAKTQ